MRNRRNAGPDCLGFTPAFSKKKGVARRYQVEALEQRMLLNAVSWTGAAGDNLWTTATNWFDSTNSTQHVPTSTDDVTIAASSGAIQISSGTQSINSLTSAKALAINGGTLSVGTASTINGSLTFSSGVLSGAGDVTLNNASNTWTGGTMSGTGKTIISNTGTLNISGPDDPTLSRILENDGSASWTGGEWDFTGGTVNNNSNFSANIASGNFLFTGGGSASNFNNVGTFTTMGDGTTTFGQPGAGFNFNNSGTVNVNAGTLQLYGGTETNAFNVDSTALLEFAQFNYSFSANASISGTGNLRFDAQLTDPATVNVGGNVTFSLGRGTATFNNTVVGGALILSGSTAGTATFNGATSFASGMVSGGILTGSGDVTLSGSVSWSGGTMSGTGKTIIASGGTLNITGTGAKTSTRPLEIDGQANLASGGDKVLVCNSLTIGSTGKLNLNDNAMILDYTGASPISTIQLSLTGGYASGAWNGNGIMSSTAASTPNRTLGFAEASDLFTSFPATFAGQNIDSTSILVRYTVSGDANLDQVVNVAGTRKRDSSDFN